MTMRSRAIQGLFIRGIELGAAGLTSCARSASKEGHPRDDMKQIQSG